MRGMSKKDTLACQVSLGLFAGLLGIASTAHGMPAHDGGGPKHDGVRAGGATVTTVTTASGTTMNIESGSANNVIGWKDFSVKNGESVVFDSGTKTNNYLNVVTGKVTSRIDGSITGGNNVYIANTNGVVFGETASVNVGNLYVTTRSVDVDAIGTAVAGGATLALQESSIINTTAAAASNKAKAEIVSLVDGTGHSVNANKIVLEGQSVRILNSDAVKATNTEATGGVQISVSAEMKNFGNTGTEAKRAKGYIHVGGAAPANYRGNLDVESFQLVSTPQELEDMKNNPAGKYMLKNDIDLSSTTHTPIGDHNATFTGKFDGMFHEVKNMTLGAGTATDYAGLFGNVSDATIMNVGIKNATLSALNYGGAVVGKAENNSHIFNVYNESASMIGSTTANATDAGGIVGKLDNSTLDTAYNTSAIGKKAGGLVGNLNFAQIMDAYNEGAVQIDASNENDSWGAYGSGNGAASIVRNVYLHNNGKKVAGSSDNSLSVQESYQITGTGDKSTPLRGTGENDSLSAASYGTWDIAAEGGENKTWRIFEGHSLPLLTAFMKGTVQAEYSYADFSKSDGKHNGGTAAEYTKKLDSSTPTANNGKSSSRTYDALARRAVKKSDSTKAADDLSDFDIVGTHDGGIKVSTGQGRRNAGTSALLHSDQHGYDIAGANIDIKKRPVKAGLGTDRPIEREYNGNKDMTQALKDALTGTSIKAQGLVKGDNVEIDTANSTLTASVADENAGYGKALTLTGSLKFRGTDAENYEDIAANALDLPANGLKGNILQKEVTVELTQKTGIDKVYDGNSSVKDAYKKIDGTDPTLKLDGIIEADKEKAKLNGYAASDAENDKIKVNYKKEKNADAENAKNAGSHAVAYSGIKLEGEKAKNYKLVEKDNKTNVLYRQAVTDVVTNAPSTEDKEAVKASGTLFGDGTINRRNINKDTFLWNGGAATKVYDGSAEWIKPNGASDADKKITAKKVGDTGVVADEGLIESDVNKIDFTLESGKGKFLKVNNDNSTTETKNVSEATKVAYQVTATNKNADEDVLSNYRIGGVDAASGSKYDVTGEGKITPRVIDVDLLQKTGIDKTYNGKTDVVEGDTDARKYLTMGKGWVGYADGSKTLVGDTDKKGIGKDGATVTVTAVYRKKGASAASDADKNVVRDATDTKKGLANGKDVYYTFTLTGDSGHAATNYTFNAAGTAQATKENVKGAGTIDPKELKAQFNKVTRAYNGGSDAPLSLVKDAGYDLNKVKATDDVKLNLESGSTIKGTYYTDEKKTTKAVDHGAGYTVQYTGLSQALVGTDKGNYWIADAADGLGDIEQAKLTKDSFTMLKEENRVVRTYNGYSNAPREGLNVTVKGTLLKEGVGYNFLEGDGESEYYKTTENTGNFQAPNANAKEDAAATLHDGAKAYGVKYTIKLLGDTAKNYDLSSLAGGDKETGKYTVNGNKITFEQDGIGYIKSRRVYVGLGTVAKGTPAKPYDGTTRWTLDTLPTDLVTMDRGIDADTGIVYKSGSPEVKNKSEAIFENRNAGTPASGYSQKVVYTPKVDGVQTNYVFYHGPQQTGAPENPYVGQKWDPTTAPLTGHGKITPKDLLVETPNDVKRQYNGDIDVKAGQGKLTLGTPLKHESAPGKNDKETNGVIDDVHLNEIDETKDGTGDASKYYRHYNAADANAGDSEEAKKKQKTYVTYRRIKLTGEDAGNYRLVYKDASGVSTPLEQDKLKSGAPMFDDKGNPYYTMTGYGLIDKRKVTSDKLKIGLKTAHPEKVYDGNEYVVGKAAKEDKTHQAWNDLIERIYVEDGTEKITVDKKHTSVTDAKYLAGGGKRAKDAADNKGVELQMNFDTSALKNFDFTDPSMTNGTFAYKTTGSIKKKAVTATLTKTMDLRKVYDKTNVAANANVKYEGVIEEDKDTAKINITKAQYEKKAGDTNANHDGMNATVDPFAAAQNIYDVAYEFDLTGADAGNYELNTKKLTGSGDIERRMAFADTVHPKLMKYYDGTNAAKSYNKDTNANEDIEDKDLSNANDAKSIKLLDAAGAEFSDDRLKNRATGLLDGDTWSAKGEFNDKNAGENKKVTYKITLSDGANDNYRIYKKSDLDAKHANGATLNDVVGTTIRTDAGKAELTDVGTVKKANLLVKADEAQKVYDGDTKTDTVEGNILTKLKLDGVYYDTTKSAVKTGGAYEGTATLNHEKGKDEYQAEYHDPNVKPKDGKPNSVNYSHIRLVDQANNYNLVYQTAEGIKNLETDTTDTTAGYYKLEGKGKITPLEIDGMGSDFKPDAITKTYDGTKDIKDVKKLLKDSNAKVWVKNKSNGKLFDITKIDGAYSATGEYKDTEIDGKTLKAKDAGTKKDVTFTFTVDKDNFIYTGSSLDKPIPGIGTITRRHVKLNVQDVQKIYDGTTGVKHGYYEGVGSDLKEHENEHVDPSTLIKAEESRTYTAEDEAANKDHKEGTLNDRGLLDGVTIDAESLAPKYRDKKANRSPDATPEKKDVFYKLRLNGDSNENYTFEVYDGSDRLIAQKDAPAEYQGYNLVGRGDIWYRKVEFNRKGLDKEYDGNALLQSRSNDAKEQEKRRKALKEKLYLQGNDGSRLFLDDEAVGKIRGTYGDGDKSGFTPNSHVKRKDGSEGTVLDRDVQLEGLYEAFKSLRDRDTEGEGARNYFYNGYGEGSKESYVAPNDVAYGTGKITPKTVKLKKTWIGGFEKPYDGTSLAKIKGADGHYYSFGEASSIGENDTEATKTIKQDVKQQFYNKLHLSVDLGTGEGAITLGYELDGGAGDDPANMPYYENPTRTTDKRDANVYNDSKLTDNKKDIVYRLKTLNSEKKYKDWEVDKGDMTARLLDGGSSHTAQITPRTIEVDAKNTAPIAKIYDGTNTVKDLLHVKGKSFDSEHPDFAYQASSGKDSKDDKPAILDKDKGTVKVVATAPAGDQAFHDRKTGAKDKNATMDAKTWEELANRKDYSAYNTENKSGKVVHYNLTLKSVQNPDNPSDADKIALGNYKLKTDTYDASAEIVKRKVKVELDAVAPKETLTREYDGTTNADVRGLHFSSTGAPQTGVVGDEKVLLKNVDRIREEGQTNPASGLNKRRGIYDTKNVKRDANGVVRKNAHTITYGNLALNDDAVSKNYEIDPANLKTDEAHPEYGNFLQDSGTINPKGLKAELLRQDVQKQYDGTREVKDNAYGTFREGNFRKVLDNEDNKEKNLQEILTKDNKAFHLDANFDSAGASALDANKQSKADKQVTYDIAWNNGNYKLLDKDGNDLTQTKVDKSGVSFTATVRTQPQSGTIYRRRLQVTASEAQKVYDGTTHVKNAWGNLHFANVDKDGSVLKSETPFANSQEEQRAKNIVNAKAAYDNPNATDPKATDPKATDPKAKNPEESDLMNHEVTYRFEDADDVMKNYEILDGSQKNVDVIKGTGKIRRRTLDVLPDWQATYVGKGGMNYTGRIADGSAQANEGSSLTPEVAADVERFNSGVFFYGPDKKKTDFRVPGQSDIQGWYRKDGVADDILASGNYGRNYTLQLKPSKLFVAPRVDKVVPERTIRPDSKVYQRVAFDESNAFGKSKDLDAALAYKGEGVNIGGTKSQQGTSANVGLSYRDQGVNMGTATPQAGIVSGGTNIGAAGTGNIAGAGSIASAGSAGSAASVGGGAAGTAGAGAGNAAGAGTNRGAQSGNAALAGGTAGIGGRVGGGSTAGAGASYRPGAAGSATIGGNVGSGSTAGAGGSYRPGAAGSATIGGNVGGGSTAGAGGSYRPGAAGSVDRGLAAAAGMSNATGGATAGSTAQSSTRAGASSAASSGYSGGGYSAVDRALADAAGQSIGSNAGYYSGRGYSQSDDDEEEEIRRRARNQASA